MSLPVRVHLFPAGKTLSVPRGTPLQDALFAEGVEFPCGGQGRCRGCRIQVLSGRLPVTPEDEALFTPAELADHWRLACRATAEADLTLELAQWDAAILSDHAPFAFTPRDGLGVAVDLGTTTLVVQLLDLRTGAVLGVRTALNAQARHGADIMTRLEFALRDGSTGTLTRLIRGQIGGLIGDLLAEAAAAADHHGHPWPELADIVLVGNTAMHHLFGGLDVEPLSRAPFETAHGGAQEFSAGGLDWPLPGSPTIRFLPCLGGFVGSDLLAGVLATGLHESEDLRVLVDLGTNGEMVVGNRERLLCASTAAGPAFEGARLSCGMRAVSGAIAEVTVAGDQLHCRTLGQAPARGLCGSGLVDAVACALDLGLVRPDGRLTRGDRLGLAPSVSLLPSDIRELQLAKAAIAAGLRLLLHAWGATPDQMHTVWLAGAFGNYINRASARRIGLLDFPGDRIRTAGNAALLGAKLALFLGPEGAAALDALRLRVRHVSLHEDPQFMDAYVAELGFPPPPAAAPAPSRPPDPIPGTPAGPESHPR